MDKKAETKAIEKWLRMMDKPLSKKEPDKKGKKPKDEQEKLINRDSPPA